jgi:voltage-gated potassium channel
MAKTVSLLAMIRRAVYRQLDPQAWGRHGLSPLNWFILGLVMVSIGFGIIATEPGVRDSLGETLHVIDHAILFIFAIEYVARMATIGLNHKYRGFTGVLRYALKPASLADLIVILPIVMSAPPTWLVVIRLLRLLRLARLAEFPRINLAITEFLEAMAYKRFELIMTASGGVLLLIVSSTSLYLAERHGQPEVFGSIPRALWWAVVTFTTVGYGDAVPETNIGRILAGFFAIAGLALGAMLTGVFASALTDAARIHKERKNLSHD